MAPSGPPRGAPPPCAPPPPASRRRPGRGGCLPRTRRSIPPATTRLPRGAPPLWRGARRSPRTSPRRVVRSLRPRESSSTGGASVLLVLLLDDLCGELALVQTDAYPLASPHLIGLHQRVPPFVEGHCVSPGEDLQGGECVQARGQPFVPMPAGSQRAASQRLQLLLQPRHFPFEPVQPLARVLHLQSFAQRPQHLLATRHPFVEEVLEALPRAIE